MGDKGSLNGSCCPAPGLFSLLWSIAARSVLKKPKANWAWTTIKVGGIIFPLEKFSVEKFFFLFPGHAFSCLGSSQKRPFFSGLLVLILLICTLNL